MDVNPIENNIDIGSLLDLLITKSFTKTSEKVHSIGALDLLNLFDYKCAANERDLIYAAGFFDGEGCVCIIKPNKDRDRPNYNLSVSISNTNENVMNWFRSVFNANVYSRKSRDDNHRDYHVIQLTGDKAAYFLLSIVSHLKIKKEQAVLGIKFQLLENKYAINDETPVMLEWYRNKVSALNHGKDIPMSLREVTTRKKIARIVKDADLELSDLGLDLEEVI